MAFVLRYFFDPGTGVCLWAANDAARERFGYPVDARVLPLPENLQRRISYICSWFDTSIDWDYPPDPSPWSADEAARFHRESSLLLDSLRKELGVDFEIRDERDGTAAG